MIPGFEQAFSPLKGYHFANERSRTNALWLAMWLHKAADTIREPFRPPMVVITGPHGETSRMAHKFCKMAGLRYSHSMPWPLKVSELAESIVNGSRAVICEKFGSMSRRPRSCSEIGILISSPFLKVKEAGESIFAESIPVRTVVIIAAGEELSLPADLARRAVTIQLRRPARGKATRRK